ncbi:MAG: 1-acyl-sn-glycerol-3-phosphate acyltransferase [Chitinophagaceae bacterium]|nr:1-acyl-sn-glycerol-3-phosphate acyltransferase [Anaerolineae bacterium]
MLRLVGKSLLGVLSRTAITGRENLPQHGPLILVGNHVAMIEVVLMVLHVPWLAEILGVGDVPLDPTFAPIINSYGFIPVNRGSVDRKGMTMALDVLAQNGVIGIFPEGGIWEANLKQARSGVAWLSSKANAPILPIGFGGMDGAIGAMAAFKRPQLIMNIGQVIPPIQEDVLGKTRKQALADGADYVMERVEALIPPEEKARWRKICEEHFELKVFVNRADGESKEVPPDLAISEDESLAKFFHRPVLLNTLARNVKLPVQPLQRIATEHNSALIADAAKVVLDYLVQNPYYLTYRFGNEGGMAMQNGLVQLRDLARWSAEAGYSLTIKPIRRYRYADSDVEIIEESVTAAHKM